VGEPVLSGLMPPPGMPRPERSVHPGVCGDSIVRFTLCAEPESDVLPLQLNEEKAVVQGGQGTGEVVSGSSRDDGSLSGLIEAKLERCVRSPTPMTARLPPTWIDCRCQREPALHFGGIGQDSVDFVGGGAGPRGRSR
jgi:hypothetical protein